VKAVDTNVLVRLWAADNSKQTAAARALFASQEIWIAKTVLLETGWVLRSHYGFAESEVREAFVKLLGLKNVHVEDSAAVASALELVPHGVELADALHLTSRPAGASFHSFDRVFVRRAVRAGASDLYEM
jgi:predicted nucleic-acid-binding protein